ncbi:N-acetylglucosamine-6-phosphate deacetylase [Paenibacillus cymbidii]|uniref:N-acetylglucosamine-6-phosphate deacetylase n=1 Tax=Paenibacillus cymbidii TaxID=1639034 RepID=UPI0010800E94|nr:N-acetylglucosamine-6-phosphate deacetylase [Paenibacillus cymbidii]
MHQSIRKLYVNATIYLPEGPVRGGKLLVGPTGRIEGVGDADWQPPPDEPAPIVDAGGFGIMPGLIDVHVHGGGGFQMMDATFESVNGMSRFHAAHGTTAFLATTGTASVADTRSAVRNAVAAMAAGTDGAELLGIHLEGPFLNAVRAGAQNKAHLRPATIAELELYAADAPGAIRQMTIAPEIEGAAEAIRWLLERGIAVSLGHSDATYAQAEEAVRLGATMTTHHFNGMRPLHHREPGLTGAGLALPQLTTELIADGIHVHPAVVKLLFDLKTADGVCAITDAVSCAGLPDGEYGHKVMTNGAIYLKDGSSLAGSSLTMIAALRNALRFTGYAPERVLPSFTTVPARLTGAQHRKGALAVGMDADFIVVDADLQLQATYVKGRQVYGR